MHIGVIAAGDGLRLKEEGIKEPKPLIKVLGKTLLERVFNITEKFGFESCSIIINEKFKEEVIRSSVLDDTKGFKLNFVFKSTPSSLHSLYELKSFLGADSLCLMTIDSIFNESEFTEFLNLAEKKINVDGLIAVTEFVDDEKPLWVRVDADNNILEFCSDKKENKYVTGGIYFFRRGVIEITEEAVSRNINRLRNFLQYLIEKGIKLKAVPFGKIIDIDHVKDIKEAEEFLRQNESN